MPKRKNSDNDLSVITKKLRKIERKLKKQKSRRKRVISSSSSEDSPRSPDKPEDGDFRSSVVEMAKEDQDTVLLDIPTCSSEMVSHEVTEPMTSDCAPVEDMDIPSLDNDLLDILGEDPTNTLEYGKSIRPEIATRFEYISLNGLNKDVRKELCNKYLIPDNSVLIGAPVLNPEIKAALNETVVKRDKLMEARQKRLAAAISCLGEALTRQMEAKERDNTLLKLLMDTGRLLCDTQYNDSISRRNFTVYSLKKEMKEPLLNTKIDKTLFGESLSESLKAAKAVNKSGIELKTQMPSKNVSFKPTSKNWKSPVGGRRQPTTQRSRPFAASTAPAQSAPIPPAPAMRGARAFSSRQPQPPPPPPPPPHRQTRRRY